jgi:hypothetical protein
MMSAFIRKVPVALKLLRMVSTLDEDIQAAQNNGKKSLFFNGQETLALVNEVFKFLRIGT